MPVRYLTCFLVCEGNSDKWFLTELLRRALDEICLEASSRIVEVVIEHVQADHQRPAAIADALMSAGKFDLLLYHHDGSPHGTSQAKVTEVCSSLARERREPVVPVVPVRETEAWMLADPDAVASLLGVRPASMTTSGFPVRAKDVEEVADPKQLLKSAMESCAGHGTGLRIPKQDLFLVLAERIDLDRLREVPSFARWWTDMTEALVKMGYKQ
jgi:Domain of unknown function (DUF4276)